MTAPAGPEDHLSLDTLAALEEGLADASDSSAHQAHVASCELCSRRQARLRTTRALLSAMPDDPMPDDVRRRIDTALSSTTPLASITPSEPRSRRGWRSRPTLAGLSAAAAVAALVGAIVVGANHRSGNNNGAGELASGARAPASAASFPLLVSGRTYTPANHQTLLAAVDALARQAPAGSPSPGRAAAPAGVGGAPAAAARVPTELQPLFNDRTTLLRCVAALTAGGPAVFPIGVDFAHYTDPNRHLDNAPALVILLPHAGSGGHDGAYVVGPNCASAPDQDLYNFFTVLG